MMNAFKAEVGKQGLRRDRERRPGLLAQADRRHRSRHHAGREGHRHQPERSRRHGAGAAAGRRGRHSGGHRRPPRGAGRGHSRPCRRRQREGRRSPGQPDRARCSPMAPPSSTCRASRAPRPPSTATRACTTCSTRMADKYKIVFEQTAGFDRAKGLSVTEAALSGLAEPPKVIVAANDDMALGAMEAVKARGLSGIAIIGFDALPEALAQVRDGGLTATIEQFPGQQSALGVQTLVGLHQGRHQAGREGAAADAGGGHQGQSEHRRTPRRSEVSNDKQWRPAGHHAPAGRHFDGCSHRAPHRFCACTGISKSFPGVRALESVDFEVGAAEIHAFLGENGAGKSTLLKILSGAQPPDAGTIAFAGEARELRQPAGRPGRGHRHHLPGIHPRARHDGGRECLHRARTRLPLLHQPPPAGRHDGSALRAASASTAARARWCAISRWPNSRWWRSPGRSR